MLSASQIETFELCPRKWAWRYLEGYELPSNAAAQFGTEVHEQLENYYKLGKPIDTSRKSGELALAMLPYGPPIGMPGLEVEEWFHVDAWGHVIRGKRDLAFPGVVLDWKTTSSFAWAKSACPGNFGMPSVFGLDGEPHCYACKGSLDRAGRCEHSLAENIQGGLYAAASMLASGLPYADLRWVYGQKSPMKAKPVDVRLTEAMIAPTLERVGKLADEIQYFSALRPRALELPYNVHACEAFGGCAYQELCNLTPQERMRGVVAQDLESQKAAFFAEQQRRQHEQGGAGMAINPPRREDMTQNWGPPGQGNFGPPGGPQQGPPPGNFGPPAPPANGQGAPQQGWGPPTQAGNASVPGWGPPGGGAPGQQNFGPPGQPPQGYGPPQGAQQGAPPANFGPPGQGAPQAGPPPEAPKRGRGRPRATAPVQQQQAQAPANAQGSDEDLLDEILDMLADKIAARMRG